MINFIKSKVRNWKNSNELKKSDYGRDYGWHIEYKGEVIGELVECEFEDMFWDRYKVISINEKLDSYLFDTNLWNQVAFKFRNKYYNQYAPNAFPGGNFIHIEKSREVTMRALYLTHIERII